MSRTAARAEAEVSEQTTKIAQTNETRAEASLPQHPTSCTLHPTPSTPHPTPYTLHPKQGPIPHLAKLLADAGLSPWGSMQRSCSAHAMGWTHRSWSVTCTGKEGVRERESRNLPFRGGRRGSVWAWLSLSLSPSSPLNPKPEPRLPSSGRAASRISTSWLQTLACPRG